MQRIRFTTKELDLILEMTAIAEAGPQGEGDYQDWDTEGKYKIMDSLTVKAAELRRLRPPNVRD